ncbi:MAG: NUDIX hydrolase [Opitutaceae bacterium]|nr:NUDIX hydrolase [Opitutaceae bacterium]
MNPPDPDPARWEKLGEETRLKTRVFDVLGARYRHPVRGTERDFVVMQAPDWVNVVALTPDDRIVLVKQFRYGIDGFSLEIPGGVMDHAGEDPVAAGLRELREETGYAGVGAKLIGTVRPNPAIQSNRCHFVLVEGAVRAHGCAWDADEEIAVTAEPVERVLALAHSGGIFHSLVLNALMLFEPHWRARRP